MSVIWSNKGTSFDVAQVCTHDDGGSPISVGFTARNDNGMVAGCSAHLTLQQAQALAESLQSAIMAFVNRDDK